MDVVPTCEELMAWKNPEDRRAYFRRRYKNDAIFRQKHIARSANRNKQQKAHHALISRLRNRRLKIAAIQHYGNQCACCGEQTLEFLAIDHLNSGGNKHRQKIGCVGGVSFYRWLKNHNWPSGFRVLCHNCNMAIGMYGFCPHSRREKYSGGE